MELTDEAIARFHKLTLRTPGCWEWQGTKDKNGYGKMRIGGRRTGRAHRIAWMLEHGDPGPLLVCHHCDNPGCVRPSHLFIGTALDNNHDRIAKGRPNGSPGEANGTSKLTEPQVREMFDLYRSGGWRQKDLAARYGITQTAVQLILAGKNWSHLDLPPVTGMRKAPKPGKRRLSDGERSALIAEYLGGETSQTALAAKYGVSQSYVSAAVLNHNR